MPQSPSQWFVFVFVTAMGVLVSALVARLFLLKFLKPEKVAEEALNRVGAVGNERNKWKTAQLGVGLQGWVGAMEIILYSSSIVFGHPEFIAVWFATKYIAVWRTWGEEPVARTFYNRSLFGSGLNVLLGAATGGIARFSIRYTDVSTGASQMDYPWLQVANLVVLSLTFLAIVWYSWETNRLKKAARDQVEALHAPCVTIRFWPRATEEAILEMGGVAGDVAVRPVEGQVALVNVGNGPAVNVNCSFEPIEPGPGANVAVRPDGRIHLIPRGESFQTHVPVGAIRAYRFRFNATYQSMSGEVYETTGTVDDLVLGEDFTFRRRR